MKFDLVLTNPPFQDSTNRGKTPHKLWIDFTKAAFSRFLVPDGLLHQVSPSSFMSPSNKVLQIFKDLRVIRLNLTTSSFFPEVGSSFAHYLIQNRYDESEVTTLITENGESTLQLTDDVFYLPTDLSSLSMSIHSKFIFLQKEHLAIKWDYVTCHNILLRRSNSLSKERTALHQYPVFHTNNQIWWSSIRQEFANSKKVIWTRSGYFEPFFDDGNLGGTDMAYYIEVESNEAGITLAHNLNLLLPKYIMKTAKWSGFGNEKVFVRLPVLPKRLLTDDEIFHYFKLSVEEAQYVRQIMEKGSRKNKRPFLHDGDFSNS
jgi:hypothetical protein